MWPNMRRRGVRKKQGLKDLFLASLKTFLFTPLTSLKECGPRDACRGSHVSPEQFLNPPCRLCALREQHKLFQIFLVTGTIAWCVSRISRLRS